jgi:hypothetical protein
LVPLIDTDEKGLPATLDKPIGLAPGQVCQKKTALPDQRTICIVGELGTTAP